MHHYGALFLPRGPKVSMCWEWGCRKEYSKYVDASGLWSRKLWHTIRWWTLVAMMSDTSPSWVKNSKKNRRSPGEVLPGQLKPSSLGRMMETLWKNSCARWKDENWTSSTQIIEKTARANILTGNLPRITLSTFLSMGRTFSRASVEQVWEKWRISDERKCFAQKCNFWYVP